MRIYAEVPGSYVHEVLTWAEELDAPEDLSLLDEFVDSVRIGSAWNGHSEALRLSIAHLLTRPGLDLAEYFPTGFAWDDEMIRRIMHYMYEQIWPEAGPIPPEGPDDVELVKAPGPQWNVSMRYGPDAPPGRGEQA